MRGVTFWILGVWFAGVGAPAAQAGEPASSTTVVPASAAAELEQASRVYASDLRRSATRFVADLAVAEKDARSNERASVDERVRSTWELRELTVRFVRDGVEPEAAAVAGALGRHRERKGEAKAAFSTECDRIANPFLLSDREVARAIVAEWERVQEATPTNATTRAESVAGFDVGLVRRFGVLLRADSLPSERLQDLPVPSERIRGIWDDLKRVRRDHEAALAEARSVVHEAYEERAKAIQGAPLAPDAKLARIDALAEERAGFERSGALPSSTKLALVVATRHDQHRTEAAKRARRICDELAEGCLPECVELARAVLEARDDWFGVERPQVEAPRGAAKPEPPRRRPSAPSLFGRELLRNGDFDEASAGTGVPGWEIVSGGWTPTVEEGSDGFFLHPRCRDDVAEIRQRIGVADAADRIDRGSVVAAVSGWIRAYRQKPGDRSQIALEFLDRNGVLLGTAETRPEHSRTWVERTLQARVPVGTRSISLVLRAIKRTGGCRKQKNNDGYFDEVSLELMTD